MADPRAALKARVDSNRAHRQCEIEKTKPYLDRMQEIKDAKEGAKLDFWCDECQADFEAYGMKHTRDKAGQLPQAWYAAYCPRRHRCVRNITEKHNDPYYYRSTLIKMQRERMADAFLTPNDPRFRIVYPDVWRKMEEQREAAELNGETT